jgi:hypothetical protein
MSIDVSEEHVASFFRAEEQAKQEASVKHIASRTLLATCFTLVSYLAHSPNVKIEA